MVAFIHKTLSFATGAAIAFGCYIYLSDQITLNYNRLYNKTIRGSETARLANLPMREESIDYVESVKKTSKRVWNTSLMGLYGLFCKYFESDKSFSEQVKESTHQWREKS